MRALRPIILWLAVCFATSSQAASLPYESTFRLDLFKPAPFVVAGSGVAGVNGGGSLGGPVTALSLPSLATATTALILDVTDPAVGPIRDVQLTAALAGGTLTGSPLGGSVALLGVVKVCLFASCSGFVPANVTVPLSGIGAGGSAAASSFVNITVGGAPWTSGTVMVGPQTITGFAHGPLSASHSAASPGGVVQLVSPIFVATNLGTNEGKLLADPTHAILEIRFVPEPGTALLLGGGTLGLVLRGARKRRARGLQSGG